MGKNQPKQEVTAYRMSIHFGIAAGPLDYILSIIVGEKVAWEGEASTQQIIDIDKRNLFGGLKKEGGVLGSVFYLPGEADQLLPSVLASKFERTPETMPGYRGLSSAFFVGENGGVPTGSGFSGAGFYWTANSPYLKGVWIKCARAALGLADEYARIWHGLTRESREVANIERDDVNEEKLADIHGAVFVHCNVGMTQIIVENIRTGVVTATIDISYTPVWLYIVRALNQIVAVDGTGIMHVYGFGGGEIETLSGWGDPTPPGDPDGQLNGSTTEIVVDGVTYMFSAITNVIYCFSNDGSGWTFNWADNDWSFFGNFGGNIAASPDYLVVHMVFGHCWRVSWTPSALGTDAVAVDFFGLLNWDVTGPGSGTFAPINSVTYVPATDRWFFTAGFGPMATFNSDLTAVVSSGDTGAAFGTSIRQIVKGRSMLRGTGTAAFVNDEDIYFVDIATCEVVETIPLSEWSEDLGEIGVEDDAGYSSAGAFYIAHGDTASIVMLPADAFDANPIHMIYESMTHTDWGIGLSPLFIDLANFEAAAETIYGEGFGLSMIWTRQTSIESFIQEILDHIDATLFLNPRTGLFTIKLIRDDYDIEDLKVFNPDNADIRNFKRKLFGETTNEIIVTWTNPENEQEETVNVQDAANIAIQDGEIISDNRNYYGIRNRPLAMSVGMRDLRVASAPLASCDIEVDRTAWDSLPGDCIVLVSPDDDIEQMVMRVGPIDYGRPGSPSIKISLVEDIFSLEAAEYTVPDDSEWVDPREEPSAADFSYVFTLPYYMVAALVDDPTTEYPTVYAGILAAEEGQDTDQYELYGTLVDGTGAEYDTELGTRTIVSHAVLADPLVAEAETVFVAWPEYTQGNGPVQAGFMIIGDGDETEVEIALIASTADDGGTIYRGVLDTVPRAWPADTPVWFIAPADYFEDAHERSAAELVEYRILIQTSLGQLEPVNAPVVSATLTERPHLPLRPADVQIEGIGYGTILADGIDPIAVTWVERNRVTENTIVLAWDEATVTAEAGQTTRITVYDFDHNELTVHDGLTGLSFDVPVASFLGESKGWVKVESVRDDLVSLQGYELLVIVSTGYGYGYGLNYGGA